ncbi:hypothetical protein ACH5RR_021029 [Cinchona calisaya]|uniref:Uncharacterized protein n=1 Tax=Cinchona calisaya TaxID=153742 RepID=A0ABD2ZJF1_9GENT
MDNQRNQVPNWSCFYQEKGMDELRQCLLQTTMELESTRLKAQEELKIRDDQLFQLKDLINRAIKERNEAVLLMQQQQQLLLQLQQQNQQSAAPLSGISSIEDEPRKGMNSNNAFSSSDCEESIVSSPGFEPFPQQPNIEMDSMPILANRPLPEKGKFLQAVMKAGPLLQTLLLAGPLPQWRHPPPPLDSYQIPPPPLAIPPPPPTPLALSAQFLNQDSLINIAAYNSNISNCGIVNRKRGFFDGSDSSTEANKYQRLVLQ